MAKYAGLFVGLILFGSGMYAYMSTQNDGFTLIIVISLFFLGFGVARLNKK
jgi:uncharacterized membrane protein YccC